MTVPDTRPPGCLQRARQAGLPDLPDVCDYCGAAFVLSNHCLNRPKGSEAEPLDTLAPDMLAFIIDLEDHCQRGGDRAEGEALRARVKVLLTRAGKWPTGDLTRGT